MKVDFMDKQKKWTEALIQFELPHWDELPTFDIYIDQLIQLINDYLYIFKNDHGSPMLTKSMVNNYVKLKMIPKPINRKYNRKHLAYLIAITILKHIAPISSIKTGIQYQAKISGTQQAYELFCQEQLAAIKEVACRLMNEKDVKERPLHPEDTTTLVRHATIAVATHLVTIKIIKEITSKEMEHD